MAQVLRSLPSISDPDLLVGAATGDDAAVWRLDAERALVVTVDVITPVVDDARAWGRIAAANSVSDVYAMGGEPLLALNVAGWNRDELPLELLADAFAGVGETALAGRFHIVGGHTIDDPEPKLGLAVVGLAHPDRLLTNAGLRPDDVLVLTKPLGVGVITTAIKRGLADTVSIDAAVASMSALNATAARVAVAHGATGATDITGFGLLGHLARAARESGVDVVIESTAVPYLPGADELSRKGVFPGGADRNLDAVRAQLDIDGADERVIALLADPQTSGGLLFGVARERLAASLAALADGGVIGTVIGSVTTPATPTPIPTPTSTERSSAGPGRLLIR